MAYFCEHNQFVDLMGQSQSLSREVPENGFENTNLQKKEDEDDYSQEGIILGELPDPINGDLLKKVLHRSVGALKFLNKYKQPRTGSGVLISRDLVLTAAHNIFNRDEDHENEDFKFYIGADGVAEQYYEIEDKCWRFPEQFKSLQYSKLKYDFAIIKLKRPITFDEYMPLSLACQECLIRDNKETMLEIYGFPASFKGNYEPLNPQDKYNKAIRLNQYGLADKNRIYDINASKLKICYGISTLPGQSGCPVLVDNNIIAVHVGNSSQFNVGRIVDASLVDCLWKWTEELNAAPFKLKDEGVCPHVKQTLQKMGKKLNINLKNEDFRGQGNSLELNLFQNQLRQIGLAHSTQNSAPTIAQAKQLQVSAGQLKDQYKYELALEQYKKSSAIYEQLKGKKSKEVALILTNGIGSIYYKQGKFSLALEAFERGKTISLELEGTESQNYTKSLQCIGDVYRQRAENDAALDNYKKALIIWQKTKGKDSLEVGGTINRIGGVYLDKGDYPQALQYLKKSLQIKERAGEGNNIKAANTHNNIGIVYRNQKEYSMALQHYEKALEIFQSIKGKDSADAASTMYGIGVVYRNQGNFPRSVQMYKQAIAIYEKHQLRHRGYANVNHNLGNAYQEMKEYGQAATAYRVALSIYEQMGLAAQVKKSSMYLALCLSKLGKKQEELEIIIDKYGVDRNKI